MVACDVTSVGRRGFWARMHMCTPRAGPPAAAVDPRRRRPNLAQRMAHSNRMRNTLRYGLQLLESSQTQKPVRVAYAWTTHDKARAASCCCVLLNYLLLLPGVAPKLATASTGSACIHNSRYIEFVSYGRVAQGCRWCGAHDIKHAG